MSNNPKKGPFDLSVDLNQIPSYRTRFASMDRLGSAGVDIKLDECDPLVASDASENLREKLGSNQDKRSLPSVILRRNGVRV